MDTQNNDWKVKALLITYALQPFLMVWGFCALSDKIDAVDSKVSVPPVQQSACIRSQNQLLGWTGTQEINCGQ